MQLCVTAAQERPTSLWVFGAGGKFADNWPLVLVWRKISTKHHFNTVFQKCYVEDNLECRWHSPNKECFSQIKDFSPAYKNKDRIIRLVVPTKLPVTNIFSQNVKLRKEARFDLTVPQNSIDPINYVAFSPS